MCVLNTLADTHTHTHKPFPGIDSLKYFKSNSLCSSCLCKTELLLHPKPYLMTKHWPQKTRNDCWVSRGMFSKTTQRDSSFSFSPQLQRVQEAYTALMRRSLHTVYSHQLPTWRPRERGLQSPLQIAKKLNNELIHVTTFVFQPSL